MGCNPDNQRISAVLRGSKRLLYFCSHQKQFTIECLCLMEFFSQVQVADVEFEVVEGDARNVLCEAVEKHHAEILVVGSHGYGAIKR